MVPAEPLPPELRQLPWAKRAIAPALAYAHRIARWLGGRRAEQPLVSPRQKVRLISAITLDAATFEIRSVDESDVPIDPVSRGS